ncbi:hypothetical protein IFU08_00940 [Microbacterium sp. CFBP 8790]|uniref:hypothetical protein n=1 Tax=unclassified Microbacterium TaxID=2609290 RepID=UPI001780D383|nr:MULTISPECIES: hypothetical protein [unclassified Microbacterium]MBD8205538.1 hypothetical protein [Microbacterium sp. CFBP 8801]MBD8508127.1 hypothetical protein [Microbacterium sp. CFBP 8790]
MSDPVVTARLEGGVIVKFAHSSRVRVGDDGVVVDLPTITGSTVGLPPGTVHISASGQLYRTI